MPREVAAGRVDARPSSGPRALALTAAAAAGALLSLVFVHTAAWPLALLLIGGLARATAASTPGRAAALGWGFGTGWLGAGVWWLHISMHRYGGLPAPLSIAAVAALSAALSLYLAAAMAAWSRWAGPRRAGSLRGAAVFSGLWLLAELARGVIFTGFPWLATGYGQIDGPLAALAPWVGVYGIGLVTAGLGAWVALALWPAESGGRRRLLPPLAVAGLLALLHWAPAGEHSRTAGTLGISLVQTNVPQDEKFALEHLPETLERLAAAIGAARGPLVVAPETAIPLLPDQLEQGEGARYWRSLRDGLRESGRGALIGRPLGSYEAGYTNSVVGVAPGADDYRYDKHHLVPFGEFIPTGFRWFTELMEIPLGDFNRGPRVPPSFLYGEQRIAPNVCYEDLFGEELGARFADPSTAPTLFANVSNIAWFGDTIAVPQHLNISRMRTLEFERPMIRATNTGATAVIDHRGRVTAMLRPFERGVLDAPVEGRIGLTPYARWVSVAGLAPLWVLALAAFAAALRARGDRRR